MYLIQFWIDFEILFYQTNIITIKYIYYLIKTMWGFKKLETQNQPDIRIDRCENAFLRKPIASNPDQG